MTDAVLRAGPDGRRSREAQGDSRPVDLFVIGGGINGAAIACDAAGRGLSVALAEARDFAEGTSSRSSKLIHGGLRYLETGDFRLVRDALQEREILMQRIPHLVRPLRLVLPHAPGLRPRALLRLGLLIYDHLARRDRLPASQAIDFRRHPAGQPLQSRYRHGFAYSDCRGDDARLVIANLLGAREYGAHILPRHRFLKADRAEGLWRVELEDVVGGGRRTLRARALVNAAGPWVMETGRTLPTSTGKRLRLVKGAHVVVPRLWEGEHGYFFQTRDGRTMEVFPYEDDFTSIGTTDEPWDEPPEQVSVAGHEIDYMLNEVNAYLKRPVQRSQILWEYAGVRPLFESGGTRDGDLSTLTRDFAFEIDHQEGRAAALTVFGGKLTTHRRLAERALAQLAPFLPSARPGRTRTEVLPGGHLGEGGLEGFTASLQRRAPWLPAATCRRWARSYGDRALRMLDGARGLPDLGIHFGADLYQREVDHLCEDEWAYAVEDVLWRRSKLGLRFNPAQTAALDAYLQQRQGGGEVASEAVAARA